MPLTEGLRVPDFELPDQDGTPVALSAFRGRRVVVYFYPRDDTPGCTTEACQFNDSLAQFSGLGVDVVGISADGGESHRAFRARYGLHFSLLSDLDHSVAERYGAWGTKPRADGSTYTGIIRSTFLVDAEGRLERAWYDVSATDHALNVLAAL